MIYIEPQGGLANRMRVIASALELQEKTGKQVVCYWVPKTELNARFEDLFLPIDLLSIGDTIPFHNRFLKSSFHTNPIKYLVAKSLIKISDVDIVLEDKDVHQLIYKNKRDIVNMFQKKHAIYFKTCETFYGRLSSVVYFKPITAIQLKIEEITSKLTSPVVGLHIRRTDNSQSKLNSPTELFIQKIDKQLKEEPNTSFYLATDDEQEEKYLKDSYGARIITHQKILDRNSLQGVQDAIVDMYCLAATDTIWGSYWSSFSEMAARLGNKKIDIVKNDVTI